MAIPTIRLQDPQLDIVPRIYYAKMGGSDITHNRYSAISSTDSQVVFSTTTPSVNVGLSRRLYWEGSFQVTFPPAVLDTSLPTLENLLNGNGGTMGLRPFPLANITDTMSLKLNNATITVNLNDIIHAVMRFGSSPDERNKYMSGSPSFPDEYPTYSDVGGLSAGARNPFSAYSTNVEEISRLPFAWLSEIVTVVNPAVPGPPVLPAYTGVRSFVVKFLEPLFISPVNWSEREVLSLFGIQTIDITLSLSGSLKNRVFAGAFTNVANRGTNNGMNNATVTLLGDQNNKPILHVLYITPQINKGPPKLLYYPYYEVGRYITNGANLARNTKLTTGSIPADAVATQNSVNNITLHSVPKRIYVYCRPKKSVYDGVLGNTVPLIYARINSISFNWNNRAGQLSSASEYDLYRMSVKNGCDQAWPEWTTYQGSVLCLEPSVDLGLSPLEAPGSRGNYQLQYYITYTNLFADNTNVGFGAGVMPFDIYTVVINEGFMTVNDSVVSLDIGVLTEAAVDAAPWADPGTYNEITNLYGGGFFGDIWKGIKKGAQVARDIVTPIAGIVGKVAHMIPNPIAQAVGSVADVVHGVGKATGGDFGGAYGGARGGRKGGAAMTKRSLSRRL